MEGLAEPEFYEGMQPGNMINMVVADEQEGGLFLVDIPVSLCDTVSGVKNDIIVAGLDQHRAGIPGERIIPSVGPKEGYFHLHLIVAAEA